MHWHVLAIIGAYVLGSIPFGLLVSQALGEKDPRSSGSNNIGFTNVLRVSGKKAGILTLIGDIGKGVAAVWLAQAIGTPRPWVLAIGLSVILGHMFSVFLVFKGGKGVATALGSVFGIEPFLGVCVLGIWIGAVILFKFSSGGALAAFLGFPILAFVLRGDVPLVIYSFCILALIVYGHMENISRLAKGTEPKMALFSI